MQEAKKNLAKIVRNARNEHGLTQEKLAEALGFDNRTIINIESGNGNPKFEKLFPLINYLKIPDDQVFNLESGPIKPERQKLLAELNNCTEEEAEALLPMVRYLLELLRKQAPKMQ